MTDLEKNMTFEIPAKNGGRKKKMNVVAEPLGAPVDDKKVMGEEGVIITPVPVISPEEKRLLALAKARETRKAKAEAKRQELEAQKIEHDKLIEELKVMKAEMIKEELKASAKKDAEKVQKKSAGKKEESAVVQKVVDAEQAKADGPVVKKERKPRSKAVPPPITPPVSAPPATRKDARSVMRAFGF